MTATNERTNMPDQEEEERTTAPFGAWLHEQRNGLAAVEWADALHELIEAVAEQGKKGSVTFTVNVEPKGRTMLVTDDVKIKKPLPDRETSIFFADSELNLTRKDPSQLTIDGALQEVPPRDTADIKEVGNE